MSQPDMQLYTNRIRPDGRLRVKQAVPLVNGHQQDIIRWRLRCRSSRDADGLEHRIGMRQIDDPGNSDVGGCKAGPMDCRSVADRDMQVGRRLLRDENAIRAAKQRPELRRIIADIGGVEAEHLAFAGCLHGCAGMGFETVQIGITNYLQLGNCSSFP